MHVRDHLGGIDNKIDLKFWNTISGIQNCLQLSDQDLADGLELTTHDLSKFKREHKALGLRQATNFASGLGLDISSFFKGNVDYKCLAQRYFGNSSNAIPELYLLNAKSKRRTVLSILNYLEKVYGYSKRSQILKNFQLNEAVFLNPDDPIHLNLTLDIAQHLFEINNNESILYNMGTFSILNYKDTIITQDLRDSRTDIESYERMFCDISPRFLEKNYKWEISTADSETIVLKGHPNEELKFQILMEPEKHHLGCIIRSGFIGGMAKLLGNHSKKVYKTQCVAKGDSCCTYHIQIGQKSN